MNSGELKGALEAIIYAADEPATLDQLANATRAEREQVRAALEEMIAGCQADERGIEMRRVARGYKYFTKPQHHEVVRKFIRSLRPPVRLSMPALETLAVISYKQPITLPEIQDIRGVNCSGVIQTLLERKLITTAGRKAVIGRPILYRTTKEFLMRFGLNDVDELPSLKEFEQLAREALGPEAGLEPAAEDAAQGAPVTDGAEAETADSGDPISVVGAHAGGAEADGAESQASEPFGADSGVAEASDVGIEIPPAQEAAASAEEPAAPDEDLPQENENPSA